MERILLKAAPSDDVMMGYCPLNVDFSLYCSSKGAQALLQLDDAARPEDQTLAKEAAGAMANWIYAMYPDIPPPADEDSEIFADSLEYPAWILSHTEFRNHPSYPMLVRLLRPEVQARLLNECVTSLREVPRVVP